MKKLQDLTTVPRSCSTRFLGLSYSDSTVSAAQFCETAKKAKEGTFGAAKKQFTWQRIHDSQDIPDLFAANTSH